MRGRAEIGGREMSHSLRDEESALDIRQKGR
jgi:hypothetical protein